MAQALYGIEEFPAGNERFRVALFGGVKRNPRSWSEPQIEVLLSKVPDGEANPLSPASRRAPASVLRTIGVGLLPYVALGSVWKNRRPVAVPARSAQWRTETVDTTKVRFVPFAEVTQTHRVFGRDDYLIGPHWVSAANTLLAAIELRGDPWALLIPAIELIRFYYVSSNRLAHALFWGSYADSIVSAKCGPIRGNLYRVHLRKWIPDSDAWTLARFHASPAMQREVRNFHRRLKVAAVNAATALPITFHALKCGFPFEGKTKLKVSGFPLSTSLDGNGRFFALRLQSCTFPFPFGDLVCDRDNPGLRGIDSGEDRLPYGMSFRYEQEDQNDHRSLSDLNFAAQEPLRGLPPLSVDIPESRFEDLAGKRLIIEADDAPRFRDHEILLGSPPPIDSLGTGAGVWSGSNAQPTNVKAVRPQDQVGAPKQRVSPTLDMFAEALGLLPLLAKQQGKDLELAVQFVAGLESKPDLTYSETKAALEFPSEDPNPQGNPGRRRYLNWARVPVSESQWRARQVIAAEIRLNGQYGYILDAERVRTSDAMSVLMFANNNYRAVGSDELWSILLATASHRRWSTKQEMSGFRRLTTTHLGVVDAKDFSERIFRRVKELFNIRGIADAGKIERPAAPASADKVSADIGIATADTLIPSAKDRE